MKNKIVAALSLAILALASCQGKGLKYDGVYISTERFGVDNYTTEYLRFYPDGKVTATSTYGPFSPPMTESTAASQYDARYASMGNYEASGNTVKFRLDKREYSGEFFDDGLRFSIDGNTVGRVYSFVPVSEAARETQRMLGAP